LAQKINNHRILGGSHQSLSLLPDQPPDFAKDQTSNPSRDDTITADRGRWGPNPGPAYGSLCRSPSGTSAPCGDGDFRSAYEARAVTRPRLPKGRV
jgi:hypothetical protein